jgi:hypothetical protein
MTQRSGWATEPRSQGICSSCYAFSAVAAVEAYVNLYFNNNIGNPNTEIRHHIDVNLAELEVMRCQNYATPCLVGNFPEYSFDYMISDFVGEEDCFTYANAPNNPPCSTKCTGPDEAIQISTTHDLLTQNEEEIKGKLIKHGPISLFVNEYFQPIPPSFNGNHVLLLVGYEVTRVGDTVYFGNDNNYPPIIIDEACNFIGTTTWILKDSYANKFVPNQSLNLLNIITGQSHFLTGIINRPLNPTEILCVDEDGDGYYWWGVHRNPDGTQVSAQSCNCPPGVNADEEDCNDNKIDLGPYNLDPNNPDPLYSCLPNNENCVTSEDPIIIDENYQGSFIWENDVHIHQNIIIRSGYQLTIKSNVFFSPGAGMFVEPNGVLILQGTNDFNATLSSGCNHFWKGVELWGDPWSSQIEFNQGKIVIDKGTIEKAEVGIKTANSAYIPEGGGGVPLQHAFPTGGIIEATNATFRNNIIGVEFYPYRQFDENFHPIPNASFFHGCTFMTDHDLLDEETPQYLLKLDGINHIGITGCIFKNINYSEEATSSFDARGIGIYSYNSCFSIDDWTTGGFNPARFEKLNYGIYGMCSGFGPAEAKIQNCDFSSNRTGAYFSAYNEVTPIDIENNTFTFLINYNEQEIITGLYLDRCSGYKVTENSFSGTFFQGSNPLIGIAINNSGAKTNYIYNNYPFKNLTCGILGQNVNRGYYTPDFGGPSPWPVETGLRFVCNDFDECVKDIVINKTEDNSSNGITFFVSTQNTKVEYIYKLQVKLYDKKVYVLN